MQSSKKSYLNVVRLILTYINNTIDYNLLILTYINNIIDYNVLYNRNKDCKLVGHPDMRPKDQPLDIYYRIVD